MNSWYRKENSNEQKNLRHINEIMVSDRIRVDYSQVEELANSIKEHGLLQAPLVCKVGNAYRLIDGGLLGKKAIECTVVDRQLTKSSRQTFNRKENSNGKEH